MTRKPSVFFSVRRLRRPYPRWMAKSREVAARVAGFTLVELLVSVFVLGIVLVIVSQLMTSATTITRTGHKQIDTDTQARAVFDRMALDLAQMVKRTDVDYYVKQRTGYSGHGNGHGWGRGHNGDLGSDQIAFFTRVPGYYPSSWGSTISLVAYRVNEDTSNNRTYSRLERMAKGLVWNGVSSSDIPLVFFPLTIDATWPPATHNFASGNPNLSRDNDYETIGPGVFRFEYYYLLKNGRVTDWPWDRWDFPNQLSINTPQKIGLTQVESIAVSIAVVDPAARALINALSPDRLLDIAADMADFKSARGRGVGAQKIGDLEAQWQDVVESIAQTGHTPSGQTVPREAAKMIRVYNRYFDLKTL
jgi:prepilin-type N-terminal cleavage/methylation domain-containing protein